MADVVAGLLQERLPRLRFCGGPKEDGVVLLRHLVEAVLQRLPAAVRAWVLQVEDHIFVALDDSCLGAIFHMPVTSPGVHIIVLSPRLLDKPRAEALFVIAQEIAHSWLSHHAGEADTDAQAEAWGFTRPAWRK